jgi:hypothetical protein
VPAISAAILAFFLSFLLQPLTVLLRQTRQAIHAINQPIFLKCLWAFLHKTKHEGQTAFLACQVYVPATNAYSGSVKANVRESKTSLG